MLTLLQYVYKVDSPPLRRIAHEDIQACLDTLKTVRLPDNPTTDLTKIAGIRSAIYVHLALGFEACVVGHHPHWNTNEVFVPRWFHRLYDEVRESQSATHCSRCDKRTALLYAHEGHAFCQPCFTTIEDRYL